MELAYGDDFESHVEEFTPDLVKTLIFHSVGDSPERKQRQLDLLARIARWCGEQHFQLMIEVLITGMADAKGSYGHGSELARALTDSLEEIHLAGIDADVWKIDGLDSAEGASSVALSLQETSKGSFLVLGSGASLESVTQWIRNAAACPSYRGFAVGRSVWTEPVGRYLEGHCSASEAVADTAGNFEMLANVFLSGRG